MEDERMLRKVNTCPWCNEDKYNVLYKYVDGEARKCCRCGLVYASDVLSEEGLKQYWNTYESKIHMNDNQLSEQRRLMYAIEYNLISRYIRPKSSILDVGCSNGDFLDFFKNDGHTCEGVEFGQDAFDQASLKYKVYLGDMCDIDFNRKYDLIIFRGVIQYLLHPKEDLLKAISILNPNGLIFITSSPNAESICHKTFKDRFRLHVNSRSYYMYSENILTELMNANGMKLFFNEQLYLETPYENYEEDILRVANAIKNKNNGKKIEEDSPPFFDNMLSLAYQKQFV